MQFTNPSANHSRQTGSPMPFVPQHMSPREKPLQQSLNQSVKPFSPEPVRVHQEESRASMPLAGNRSPQGSKSFFMESKLESRAQMNTLISEGNGSSRRNIQQLRQDNVYLLEQLAERDELIKSLKQGTIHNELPYSEETVNNINLRLASKNVLIEKISNHLGDFHEKAQKRNQDLFPAWNQKFLIIQELMNEHDQHPKVIRERFIQTSHQAEKHYIQVTSEKLIRELKEVRYECQQLKEKNIFYEQEQKKLVAYTEQQQQKNKIQGERLRSIIKHLQGRLNGSADDSQLQRQLEELKYEASQYQKQLHQQKSSLNHSQNIILELRKQLDDQRRKNNSEDWKLRYEQTREENLMYKDQINYLNDQVSDLKKRIDNIPTKQTISDSPDYKQDIIAWKSKFTNLQLQYEELQFKYNSMGKSNRQLMKYKNEYEASQFNIDNLNMEISSLKSKIRRLQDEQSYEVQEWKIKYEEASTTLQHVRNQLNQYKEFSYIPASSTDGTYKRKWEEEQSRSEELQRGFAYKEQAWEQEREEWRHQQHNLQTQIKELAQEIHTKQRQIEETVRQQYRQQLKEELYQELHSHFQQNLHEYQREIEHACNTKMELQQTLINNLTQELEEERNQAQKREYQVQKEKQLIRAQIQAEFEDKQELSTRVHEQQKIQLIRRIESQIREKLEIQIKEQLIIEVNQDVRKSISEQITQDITMSFNEKLSEAWENLNRAEEFIKHQQNDIEMKEDTIRRLEESVNNSAQNEEVTMLRVKVQQQEEAIIKGREFLQQAEKYIEKLVEQREKTAENTALIDNLQEQVENLTRNIAEKDNTISETYGSLEKAEEYIQIVIKQNVSLKEDVQTLKMSNQNQEIARQLHEIRNRIQEQRLLWEQERNSWESQRRQWEFSQSSYAEKELEWKKVAESYQSEMINWEELRSAWNKQRLAWQDEKISWQRQKISIQSDFDNKYNEIELQRNSIIQSQQDEINRIREHLKTAQQYIESSSKQSEEVISRLQYRIKQLQEQSVRQNDEFRYLIDTRLELLAGKILEIAQKQTISVETEAQFFNLYQKRRREEMHGMNENIQKSLDLVKGFESLLILKRSQFKKLTPENMKEFLDHIEALGKLNKEVTEISSQNILAKLNSLYDSQ